MPCQANDDEVEEGNQDKPDRVRERVAVELVGDKQSEHDDSNRIISQPATQETDDQPQFDDAMPEQIDRGEVQGTGREMLNSVQEKVLSFSSNSA